MPGPKTNERPRGAGTGSEQHGTRAVLRHTRVAPNKAREVLNLVRDRPVHEAQDILRFCERDVAFVIGKVLASAVANAEHNDELDPEELYVSACYADEGTTIKRWRPRARGRATRIRKRTTHITVIVGRLPEARLARLQSPRRAEQLAERSRRVAGARRRGEGRNRAERRGQADDAGIVDPTEEAVAALEEAEADGTVAETAEAEAPEVSDTESDTPDSATPDSGDTDDAKDGR